MPIQQLDKAIASLNNLSTHDLADLVDLLEHRLGREDAVRPRRRGKPPLAVARDQASDGLQRTLSISAALDDDELSTLVHVAAMVHKDLRPVEFRRKRHLEGGQSEPIARGIVQAKYVRRQVFNLETEEFEWHSYGPYLYIRTYAGGGGRNKDEKHLNNTYVGRKELAKIFADLPPRSPNRQLLSMEILEGHANGTLDEVYARWVAILGSFLKDVTPSEHPPTPESPDLPDAQHPLLTD